MNSSSIVASHATRFAQRCFLFALCAALACCSGKPSGVSASPSVRELAFQMRVDDFDARLRAGSELRTKGASAVPELIALLHAGDSACTKTLTANGAEELTTQAGDWHAYAASALGEIGPPAASAIPDLVAACREVLADASIEHRDFVTTRARAALIKIRNEPLMELESELIDVRSPAWSGALATAQELGVYGRPLVPLLASALRDPGSPQRASIVNALGRIDGASTATLPTLTAALSDGDDSVRWFALRVLGQARDPSRELLDAIAALLSDSKPSVRQQAAETLASITPAEQRVERGRQLEPLLKDRFAEVRETARLRIDELKRSAR